MKRIREQPENNEVINIEDDDVIVTGSYEPPRKRLCTVTEQQLHLVEKFMISSTIPQLLSHLSHTGQSVCKNLRRRGTNVVKCIHKYCEEMYEYVERAKNLAMNEGAYNTSIELFDPILECYRTAVLINVQTEAIFENLETPEHGVRSFIEYLAHARILIMNAIANDPFMTDECDTILREILSKDKERAIQTVVSKRPHSYTDLNPTLLWLIQRVEPLGGISQELEHLKVSELRDLMKSFGMKYVNTCRSGLLLQAQEYFANKDKGY